MRRQFHFALSRLFSSVYHLIRYYILLILIHTNETYGGLKVHVYLKPNFVACSVGMVTSCDSQQLISGHVFGGETMYM